MDTKLHGNASRWMAVVSSVGAALALAACGGGGGSGGVPQGTLQLSLTDAPACYQSVLVTVEKVRVHMDGSSGDTDGGWKEIVPAGGPVQVDLLKLTNGQVADLGGTQVDAGTYRQLRLVLAENTPANPLRNAVQPVGGSLQPLKTPSGQQSGLKIKSEFAVEAGQVQDMVLDFDACKSIVATGSGQYLLKPVVRLSAKVGSGIQGYVATTMTLGSTTVSAQQSGSVVRSTVPDASGKFTLAYLPAGSYTVVITSDGRATGVVDSVSVGTSTVALNGTATAIVLPTSVMNTVTGTVTASTVSGSTTATVAVDDALVSALQTLGTTLVEVTSVKADDLGKYSMRLPMAAPVKAPYAAAGLTFTPDAAAAGKYTVKVTAEGRSAQQKTVDVSGGSATADFQY
jgi:hypothetical protein